MNSYPLKKIELGNDGWVFKLFKAGALLGFLGSFHAWFTWYYFTPLVLSVTCFLLALPWFLFSRTDIHLSKSSLLSVALLIFAKLYTVDGATFGVAAYIQSFVALSPLLFFLLMKKNLQILFIDFFTKSMSILLFVSLIIWILLLIGVPLPNFGIISHKAWDAYVYENYILCLRNTVVYDIRFCGIFLEPGHLGVVCTLLLFLNRFQLKRRDLQIILLANLFTLSLAAYVLLLISLFIYILIFSSKRYLYIGIAISILSLGYFVGKTYNNGDNVINEFILSRLEYDEDSGISGNNRFSDSMEAYYLRFLNSDDFLFGIGNARFNSFDFGANAGYKVFLVRYGLFGLMLVLAFYLNLLLNNRTAFGVGLLVLYALSFLQRSYPFWDALIYIYILGIISGKFVKTNKVNLSR